VGRDLVEVAVLVRRDASAASNAFANFLENKTAQKIFRDYGFKMDVHPSRAGDGIIELIGVGERRGDMVWYNTV
jgi:hypothetical protein